MNHENDIAWQKALEHVDALTDGLGKGVDSGIRDTVAALYLSGIHTTGSHEGKLHRYPVPYIDIECSQIEELEARLDTFHETRNDAPEISAIENEICKRNLEERDKILPLLEEFYTPRHVPEEIKLHIKAKAREWSRLQSQGADIQEKEQDEETKERRLRDFQEEMGAFTEFLKERVFRA